MMRQETFIYIFEVKLKIWFVTIKYATSKKEIREISLYSYCATKATRPFTNVIQYTHICKETQGLSDYVIIFDISFLFFFDNIVHILM